MRGYTEHLGTKPRIALLLYAPFRNVLWKLQSHLVLRDRRRRQNRREIHQRHKDRQHRDPQTSFLPISHHAWVYRGRLVSRTH